MYIRKAFSGGFVTTDSLRDVLQIGFHIFILASTPPPPRPPVLKNERRACKKRQREWEKAGGFIGVCSMFYDVDRFLHSPLLAWRNAIGIPAGSAGIDEG